MNARDDQRHEQLLAALAQLSNVSTALAAKISAFRAPTNGVLEVSTNIVPAAGMFSRSYGVAIGSIVVSNPGAHSVTVVAGSNVGASVPTNGHGVFIVPPFAVTSIPIDQRSVTVYATTGDVIGIQVFTGLQPYGVAS